MRARVNEDLTAARSGMSSIDYALLRIIVAEGAAAASVAQLAEFLVIPRTSVRRILEELEQGGLIASFQPRDDRRERRWSATPEGVAASEAIESSLPGSSDDHGVLATQLGSLLRGLRAAELASVPAGGTPRISIARTDGGDWFNVWVEISRAYHLIRNEQTRFLLAATDNALETASYMALYRAQEASPTLTETAAFLQVNQNAALRIIDRLESRGLVRRERRQIDRRHTVIVPTKKGVELLAAVPPLDPAGAFISVVSSLPESGAQLADALERLVYEFFNRPAVVLSGLDEVLSRLHQRAEEHVDLKVERDVFRRAMAQFVTGVAVLTVGQNGDRRGITVNSLTSVSLEPPTLLVCLDQRSPTLERLLRAGKFAANILSLEQRSLAERFGRRESAENPHSLENDMSADVEGVPALADALASIICDIVHTYEAGTHTIVLASVRNVVFGDPDAQRGALGFWRSSYLGVSAKT
jgi:flavin reductase (DIM6/NTAB) family NADH-FMN oxidoreductase RutF/DNA-binding IscR family transcriptional regulator